jgi:hypothetical protein
MGRPRTAGMFVGLFALPVALLGALPGALPDVPATLTSALPFREDSPFSVHNGAEQLHRGVKVRVAGAAQGQLRPGTSAPVALTFQNPNSHRVRMMKVRVRIVKIVAPNADAAHPCTTADYSVRQMPRALLRVPARRSMDLVAMGLPTEAWPRLTMLNRPLNQDGCKGAQLTLRFKARGLRRSA